MDTKNTMSNILSEMPRRIPREGTFELTVRCNLHCKMCMFRHDDKENPKLMKKELTTEQWIDMAKQAAEAGTLQLLITGGEPMLRPDFCEIWEGIYKQGFILELYTNATLVTPKIMETLRKYPPHMIGITIYGASPETYDKVCANANAYQRVIDGIHMLKELPSIIKFRTTIIKDNQQDIEPLEQLVKNQFGENSILTHARLVTKGVRGSCADVEACRLSPQESFDLSYKRTLRQFYPDRKENDQCVKFVKIPKSDKNSLTLFGCKAGMSNYTITWDGKLQGCQILEPFQVDVTELGFQAAWDKFPFIVQIPPLNPTCTNCELAEFCECCYAFRYSETGSLQGIPEYICKNTNIINKILRGKTL